MNLLVDRRPEGSIAMYIDGFLQFDSQDEAVYHESLVLPALCLAKHASRILICGGGDGLAARECLRFPGVVQVDLVDRSAEVLAMGRTEFAALNGACFEDERLWVHECDAWDFVRATGQYDVIVCDFTFPMCVDDAHVFSREWFELLRSRLTPGGMVVTNAVSPQASPEAFAVLVRTMRAARLCALPYRVCVPSFREHGYGAWGAVIGSTSRVGVESLKRVRCPVETRQADISALARGAHFSRAARQAFARAPISKLDDPTIIDAIHGRKRCNVGAPPSLDGLMDSLPFGHMTQSREMLETLAESVIGTVRTIDLRRLVESLWRRAARLPERLRVEIERIRYFVSSRLFDVDDWAQWSAALFASLVVVLTVANSMAPDNAYAKGAEGFGHASMSRGYAGAFSTTVSTHAGIGQAEAHALSGRGFSRPWGGEPVDIYGYSYPHRVFYYHSYYGGYGGGYSGGSYYGGGHRPSAGVEQHAPLFVADEDMMVMDNGDVVITLSDKAYLLVSGADVLLMRQDLPDPVARIWADPKLFAEIIQQIRDQAATADVESRARQNWLSWVGWTSSLFVSVQHDRTELQNLGLLSKHLALAEKRLRPPSSSAPAVSPPADAVELFIGAYYLSDGRVAIYGPDGNPKYFDPDQLSKDKTLGPLIGSVASKLVKELKGDLASLAHDRQDLASQVSQTRQDLAEYQSIQQANWADPSYEVDYGTDSIPVGDAISRTQGDLAQLSSDQAQTESEYTKNSLQLERISALARALPSSQ